MRPSKVLRKIGVLWSSIRTPLSTRCGVTAWLWFDYPVHHIDESGVLADVSAEGEAPAWQNAVERRKESAAKNRRSKAREFEEAVNNCNAGSPPTVKDLMEFFSTDDKEVPARTIRDWVKRYGYWIDRNTGCIYKKEDDGDYGLYS